VPESDPEITLTTAITSDWRGRLRNNASGYHAIQQQAFFVFEIVKAPLLLLAVENGSQELLT